MEEQETLVVRWDSVLLPVGLEAGFSGQLGAEVLLNYH